MIERSLRSLYRIIGRERELKAIEAALEPPRYHQVLYFEGQGGVGKTRLLMEARMLSQPYEQTLSTNVIDLYLTRHHQPIGMMNTIAHELRASLHDRGLPDAAFTHYDQAQAQFLATRSDHADVEHMRHTMVDEIFLHDFARLAERYNIVLLVDTFEKLHPEIVETEAFNFRQHSRLEVWLTNLIASLPNTLTLLAGRPRSKQRQLLEETFGTRLSVFPVQPFTLQETEAYVHESLESMPDVAPLSPETITTLHHASAGRPVVLSIALACSQAQAFDIEALPAGFEEQYPANRKQLSDDFVNLIISDLQEQRPELADMLTKAVYLRKGLRPTLLAHIAQSQGETPDLAQLEADLDDFAKLSFVKVVGEGQTLLHDEMYELLFGKLSERESTEWYRAAINYLDQQLRQLVGSTTHAQQSQMLKVERLFYHMSLDPRHGYQEYRELSNSAIQARDEDFDTQLQDEIARFFDEHTAWGNAYRRRLELAGLSWEQMMFDEGVRWVYRRITSPVQGASRYSDAVAIAERVRATFPEMYQHDALARSALEVAQLQAEIFIAESTPRSDEIMRNYQRVTQELEDLLRHLTSLETMSTSQQADMLYAKLLLADAYNYWGYFDRVNGRLQSAIDKYKQAIRLFKELGPEVDNLRAITLNNLGFAMSRQGDSRRGLEFVRQALHITQAGGSNHRVATTLNTLAHVHMDLSEVDAALESVTRARTMFESMDSMRGLALCALAEGRVRNRLAGLWQNPQEQDEEYARTTQCYKQAIDLFDNQVEGELSRRIEARMWYATVLRDWGTARSQRGEDGSQQMQPALDLLHEAQSLCTSETSGIIRSHIFESMAVVFINQQQYEQALNLLHQARDIIPEEYDVLPGFGVTSTPRTQELRIYWLRLAQVELQFALYHFGTGNPREGSVRLLRGIACLMTFSPHTPLLGTFHTLGKRELMKIGDSEHIKALRHDLRAHAQTLRVEPAAAARMEEIFEEVLEDLSLL